MQCPAYWLGRVAGEEGRDRACGVFRCVLSFCKMFLCLTVCSNLYCSLFRSCSSPALALQHSGLEHVRGSPFLFLSPHRLHYIVRSTAATIVRRDCTTRCSTSPQLHISPCTYKCCRALYKCLRSAPIAALRSPPYV